MAKTIHIERSPWSTAQEQSPAISPQEFAVKIATVPAKSGDRPTVALLGAYRLPGPFGLMYGSRVSGVLRVVAINPDSGALFFNHAEASHAAPIELSINPDAQQDPSEPALVAVEGFFNLDLADHLGLPPDEAEYRVFAWLDDVTTESLTVLMPEDKQRPRSRTKPGRVDPPVVKFGRTPKAVSVGPSPISLRWVHEGTVGPLFSEVVVFGAVSADLLPKHPPDKDEPSTFLTVMAMGSRKRGFRWHSVDLPNDVIERRECVFQLNLGLLVDQTDPPQKAFVMVVLGTTKSEVLVVDPLNPAPRSD